MTIKNNSAVSVVFWLIQCFIHSPGYGQTTGVRLSLTPVPPTRNVVAACTSYDKGPGNTSIAFDDEDIYKWSGASAYKAEKWGYYTPDGREIPYIKRDRDLGQTFLYDGRTPKTLTAITVAIGPGTNAVRPNTYGQGVSIQVFEVMGEPVVNDNGTAKPAEAFHGYPHDRPGEMIAHDRDDFLTGETYTSLAVFSGAVFPGKKAFGFKSDAVSVPADDPALKGKLLRFELPTAKPIVLQPGKRYAFLVMIDKKGPDFGFTLANQYYGTYPGGHGIRRDGDGVFPPVAADPTKSFTDPANANAFGSAHFPADMKQRSAIPPGTNGYPDVCTWRDLLFYVEAK